MGCFCSVFRLRKDFELNINRYLLYKRRAARVTPPLGLWIRDHPILSGQPRKRPKQSVWSFLTNLCSPMLALRPSWNSPWNLEGMWEWETVLFPAKRILVSLYAVSGDDVPVKFIGVAECIHHGSEDGDECIQHCPFGFFLWLRI